MSTEQRVVSGQPKIGARVAAKSAPSVPEPVAPAAGSKRKRLMAVALGVLLVIGGVAFWLLRAPAEGVEEVAEPEHGKVQTVQAFSLNLAEERYLRLGLGLQLSEEVVEDIDTSKAVDRALTLFSGRSLDEVSSTEGRTALKTELTRQLQEVYEGEVLDVYFTDYVTQ